MNETEIRKNEREKRVSEHFTVEEIKAIKGFENTSDEEAQEIINTLISLCWMFCDLYHSTTEFIEDESDQKLAA